MEGGAWCAWELNCVIQRIFPSTIHCIAFPCKLVFINIATAIFHYTSSDRNFDSFAGYSNESLYKYLGHALEEDNGEEVFSLYAGK